MTTPILYYRPGACALAPMILLQWIGADHETVHAERDNPDLLAINPSAAVPAYRTKTGVGLTQAGAILQHIAHAENAEDYIGGGDADLRDQVAIWSSFFTGDFHPAFWPFFAPMAYTTEKSSSAHRAVKEAAARTIRTGLAKIDEQLEGRNTFVGNGKTIIDAYSVPMLRWANNGDDIGFRDFKNAARFYDEIVEDAGVKAAMGIQGINP